MRKPARSVSLNIPIRDSFGSKAGKVALPPLARAALDRYLDAIATHRAFARLFVVEAHAAGPRALLRRAELQAVVVDALVDLLAARDANARFACEAFVAAVSALVTLPLATGDVDALRALRNPLVGRLRALADETSR